MSVLDQVTQMKSQGKPDSEIIRSLQDQGLPPMEIQEALSQAQIKNAISGSQVMGMEQSIMDQGLYNEEQYSTPEAPLAQAPTYTPQIPDANYAQDYSQQAYPQQQYYQDESYSYQSSDTGTLVEVSEQVFNDKIRKAQKQLDSLNEFKALSETRLKNMEERLKRMEEMFDKLQISILDKVGSYGRNLSSLQKEMNMVQDSFSKAINPLLYKAEKRGR